MKNDLVLRPSYWANVSGGKDSLYMLKLILENPDLYPLDGVIHCELEYDFPFIKNVIDYMESECEKYGVRFVRIKPRMSWYELYKKRGFPSNNVRWCLCEYKLDAIKQLKEFLKSQNCYLVSYIGYCADEVKRYENRKILKEVYPLVDFNIKESTILEWAKEQNIFNDYYKINKRCGCMFCPFATKMQYAYTMKYYPNEYKKLMQLYKESEKRFPHTSKYQTPEYIENIVKTKWLPRLKEKLKEL